MSISLFDLLKIGIGPSSSHTVGPMKAALMFAEEMASLGKISQTARLRCTLYGSLGATGIGHGSGPAVIAGLMGQQPETVDPTSITRTMQDVEQHHRLKLLGYHEIYFNPATDLIYQGETSLPHHANGMELSVCNADGERLCLRTYYSVGGGFIQTAAEMENQDDEAEITIPYPFVTAADLLKQCQQHNLSISELMLENEKTWRSEEQIRTELLKIWSVMLECIRNGIDQEGVLPGGLNVKRRAPALYQELKKRSRMDMITPSLGALDWVNLYALAVSEENAAGGRMVTAPTNGAAGIIPAVLRYYDKFCPNSDEDGIINFMLGASAIGLLCKYNASISGAEVGCQGEVGSACAMAAAGLAEAIGASPEQVENAAEIAIEHNLGLTCDPVGGLVQVPCIERNAMAAMKAINAATMAIRGDGNHFVLLDDALKTMRDTGYDMHDKYKETSQGGLAVNVIEC